MRSAPITSVLTSVLLLLQLCACAAPSDPSRSALVVARPTDALTLDPAAITDNESMQVAAQIFETLVRYRDGTTEVEPSLATRWDVADEGRLWTFHLRRGVTFHDGTPLTPEAVVLSFERQLAPNHPLRFQPFPYWHAMYGNIVAVSKHGRHAVRIRIDKPFAPFLANMALFPVSIVSPGALRRSGGDFARRPVGTGPYRFVRWDPGSSIVLARNSRYWGRPPRVARLIYRVVPSAQQRLISLQSGSVDVVHGLAPEDVQIARLHPDLRVRRVPANNVAYLAINTRRKPFHDVRVRRALRHAINNDAATKLVYQGLGVPARGPLPPALWGYEPQVTEYGHDPARARALLEEAGFDFGRRVRLLVMSTPRPYLPSPVLMARVIAHSLTEIGMSIELIARPHGQHLQALRRGDHDLCLLGWVGDNGDPDNFLYVLLASDNARPPAAQNIAFFRHRRVDELLRRARAERDRAVRERLYREVQRIFAEQSPWVPLAHADMVIAHRRALKNLQVQPSNAILYHGVSF